MQFGKIEGLLDSIDFTLPSDANEEMLGKATKHPFEIYIGGPRWGRKEWVGKIYPPKTPANQMLVEYAKQFDAVEFGTSFYSIQKPQEIESFKEKVKANPNFKFSPKFPQAITHIRRFKNTEALTNEFYIGIRTFKENLGPLLLQLSDTISPKIFPDLEVYLKTLPTDIQVFLEVRNQKWFNEQESMLKLTNLLKELGIGFVITDASERRDAVHMQLTIPKALIRFAGNNLDETDFIRLDDWVQRLKGWKEQGLQSSYFFIHSNDERHVPALCDYFIKKVNRELDVKIKEPVFL